MSRPGARLGCGFVALTAVLAACGVRTEHDARFVDHDEVPFDLLDVGTTQPPEVAAPTGATSNVELCFVDGDLVAPAIRPASPDIDLPEVTRMLADGPNRLEEGAGLGSVLPDGAIVGPVESTGGVAEVDLAESFADAGGQQQLLAIAQLVCTLTARPGIGQVAFTLDGEPIAVPRGDASTTTDPVTRDDYRRVIASPGGPTSP